MKKYLLIMQQSPFANSQGLEALELAFALSAFDQEVSLLFKGEAVLQLLSNIEGDKLVGKDFTKVYEALDTFGIKDVYVEEHSLQEFANTPLLLNPKIVDSTAIAELIKQHDVVFSL